MRKLLWVMVCLHAIMSVSEAADYVEYKTARHSTCSEISFASFAIDRRTNEIYALGEDPTNSNNRHVALVRISRLGVCKKIMYKPIGELNTLSLEGLKMLVSDIMAVDSKRKYLYIVTPEKPNNLHKIGTLEVI